MDEVSGKKQLPLPASYLFFTNALPSNRDKPHTFCPAKSLEHKLNAPLTSLCKKAHQLIVNTFLCVVYKDYGVDRRPVSETLFLQCHVYVKDRQLKCIFKYTEYILNMDIVDGSHVSVPLDMRVMGHAGLV